MIQHIQQQYLKFAGDTVSSSDNLGLKKKATASSSKGANTADMILDGTTDTRWQADNEADDEWIQVDRERREKTKNV